MTQDPRDPHLWQTGPSGQPYGSYPPALPGPYLGAHPQQPYYYGQPIYVTVPHSGVATASLVCGILGVVFGFCTFGLLSAAAVMLGHVGLVETKNGRRSGRGAAVAGLILGYLFVVPMAIFAFSVFGGWLSEQAGR